jgi:hypothetical protein
MERGGDVLEGLSKTVKDLGIMGVLAGIQRDHLREYGKNVTAWMSFPGGTL